MAKNTVKQSAQWFSGPEPESYGPEGWDASHLANAIIDAFLYEFLTMDDASVAQDRLNGLIEALGNDPEWAPIIKGSTMVPNPEDPTGATFIQVPTTLQVESQDDVKNIREAIASVAGSDEAAYQSIVKNSGELHRTQRGRNLLQTIYENWGVVVGEQYASGSQERTKTSQPEGGYPEPVNYAPFDYAASPGPDSNRRGGNSLSGYVVLQDPERTEIDKMFDMPGIGDDGSRNVMATDFMVFLSLVNNTGIVTKGNIDNVVALQKVTSFEEATFGEWVMSLFDKKLPDDINYLQENIKVAIRGRKVAKKDYPPKPEPKRWIPIVGLGPRISDKTKEITVYYEGTRRVSKEEALVRVSSTSGNPYALKAGYTSHKANVKVVEKTNDLTGWPLQCARTQGIPSSWTSGPGADIVWQIIPGPEHNQNTYSRDWDFSGANPLQARVDSIVRGTATADGLVWDVGDGEKIKFAPFTVENFRDGPMTYYKNWLQEKPDYSRYSFSRLSQKRNVTSGQFRRQSMGMESAWFDGPYTSAELETARKRSMNNQYAYGRAIVTKQVQGRGLTKWKDLASYHDDDYYNKTYANNSFSDHVYWAFVDFNAKDGPNSIASVAAYNCRVMARIARCYPRRLTGRLIWILKSVLAQTAEAQTPKKTFTPKPEKKYEAAPIKVEGIRPYDLQCFLIENIRALTAAKAQELQANVDDDKRAYQNLGVIAELVESAVGEGEGETVSNSRAVQPGNLISYIQHGGIERTPQVEALLNLCPDAYALLTPYVKLYRVDYEGDNRLTPKREIEIPFPTFVDPKDISQITGGNYGRYTGAGIKSFMWSLDGVNPAEVENNISAELDLRFNTLYDLFSSNQGLQAGSSEGPGYLDLIIGSGTSMRETPVEAPKAHPRNGAGCRELQAEHYEGERFRIKATVGWSTPPDFANMDFRNFRTPMEGSFAGTYGEFLQKAIDDSRVSMYLQVTGHELSFNENGTVDLRISYQASLDGILKAPNADVFVGGAEFDEKIKELKSALGELDAEAAAIMERAEKDPSDQAATNSAMDTLTTKRLEKLQALDKLVTRNKAEKYKRFLCNLYRQSQIYMLRVPLSEIRKHEDMTPEERAELARTRLDPNGSFTGIEGNIQNANDSEIDSLIIAAQQAITKAHGKKDPEEVKNRDVQASLLAALGGKKDKGAKKRSLGRLNPETLDVAYFYLGDLIDGVLTYLRNIVAEDNGLQGSFQMLLGNVEILDPLLAFKYPEVGIRCGSDQAILRRSLADIDPLRFKGAHQLSFYTNIGSLPISLDYFQEWFVENIVRPQRPTYSFLNFVKQLCTSLIGRAFNSVCFGDALNFNLRFDTAIFNMDTAFTGEIVTPHVVARSKAAADRKGRTPLDLDVNPERPPVIPTLVLYSTDSRPSVSDSERENISNGIYHHYVGGSCGLTKKISFHRSDMPDLRAARLQREGSLSATQMRELYNVEIDMIGNNLHRNGQYIKVDPISIGVGPTEAAGSLPNLAQLIGIGGYYLVSRVKHTISSKGFDVNVGAIQEGIDFSDGELVDIYEFRPRRPAPQCKANPEKKN